MYEDYLIIYYTHKLNFIVKIIIYYNHDQIWYIFNQIEVYNV